jgi:hypothetical protein
MAGDPDPLVVDGGCDLLVQIHKPDIFTALGKQCPEQPPQGTSSDYDDFHGNTRSTLGPLRKNLFIFKHFVTASSAVSDIRTTIFF